MQINLLQPKGYIDYGRNEWYSITTKTRPFTEIIVRKGDPTRYVLKKVGKEQAN